MKTRFSLSRYAASYIALGVLALALFALPLWRFQLLVEPVWYGILGAFALVLSLGHMLAWRNRRLLLAELNEIKQAELRYALVMSASNDGFWDWKVAGDELYVSPRFLEIFDFPPDTTFAGRAALFKRLSMPAADREALERAVAEHFAGKTVRTDIEFRALVRGEERWMRATGRATRDASGAVSRWNGAVRDVTARRRAQEALRQSEERFRSLSELSNDFFWETDAQHRYTAIELGRAYIGVRNSGSKLGLVRWEIPYASPDEAAWAAHRAAIAARERFVEFRFSRIEEGEERFYEHSGEPHYDAEGNFLGYRGVGRDVTARKRAEEALRESEKRYERAMLASNAGLWEWDALKDEYYISARHLELLGFAPGTTFSGREDFLRRVPFHPEDLERWRQTQRQLFASGGSYLVMDLRVIGDGETRWVRVNALCFREGEGRVVRWTGSVTDVTEAKLAEEALRRSEERYSLAMDASEEGHFDVKLDTDEHFISERLNEIHGFQPAKRTTKRSEFIKQIRFYGDDFEKFHAAIAAAEAKDGPERYECEFRTVRPSGEVRWLRTCGKVTRDAEGRARRRTGVVADITQRKLAEEALRASEALKSAMFETALDCIISIDHDGRVIEFNPAAERTFGYRRAEAMGKELAELIIPPRLREQHRRGLARYLATGEGPVLGIRVEMPAVRADGAEFPVELSVTRIPAEGAPLFTAYLRDITERKRAEEKLRESEARFRALTQISSDWYWRQDENLRFTYLSEGVSERAGWPSEDYIGRLRWEVPDIHLISCSWEEHKEVLAKRQPFRDLEYWRPGKDGLITYSSISGAPVYDENGSFAGYRGVGRNITERKRIEAELRSRQEMLELAQKSAQAIAFEWRIGAAGEGQNRWSPDLEAMYGIAPGTYDGSFEGWKKLVHPEDWPAVKEAVKRARQTGEVASEYRVVHPDGSVHWLQAKGRMLFDGEGKPTRMVGFMQDVTQRRQAEDELKRMERQLRQAQRLEAMGTLAGGIAHDFNNILGAILGFGEMALRDAAKGTRLRRDLGSIMTAGERGRALVDRVLAFSRSGVGERVAVHVERGVREALDLLAAKLPQGIRIEAKLRAGRAAMLGDPTQVHQVLMNLGTNAVQAMTAGGMLSVSLDAVHFDTPRPATIGTVGAGDYIVLKVADEGIGIPAEIVERIFDPFFTTKEVGTGTGLGLSLVHGIVAEVGGAIDVASTPGAGSTFTVYLPRSGDALDSLQEEELEMPRGDGQRVLVVDDEEPLVKLATRTLEDLGYSAAGFTSSAAALSAFRAEPERFQALITDERMPGMSGSALIREVRIIHKSIPIVLMSGFVGGLVLRTAREAGADEVLKKPLSARDLANSLARVLHP